MTMRIGPKALAASTVGATALMPRPSEMATIASNMTIKMKYPNPAGRRPTSQYTMHEYTSAGNVFNGISMMTLAKK